jgi:hypothetical protein
MDVSNLLSRLLSLGSRLSNASPRTQGFHDEGYSNLGGLGVSA